MCFSCNRKTIIGEGGYGIITKSNRPDKSSIKGSKSKTNQMVTKCQPLNSSSPSRELLFYHYLNHPNIPKIYNCELIYTEEERYLHFDMKRMISLMDYLNEKDMRIKDLISVYISLVDTVSYVQSRWIYHQDIRPENILLDASVSPPIPYLIDFGLTSDTLICKRGWNDPAITEWCCFNTGAPPIEMLLEGDSWSLGLLGIYMFADREIYDWTDALKPKRKSMVRALRNRFEGGSENWDVDLDQVPEEVIELIELLLRRTLITNGYKEDRIHMREFNDLETVGGAFRYVNKIYTSRGNPIKETFMFSDGTTLDQYITNLKTSRIESSEAAIKTMKEIISKLDQISTVQFEMELIRTIYNDVLPRCYQYIDCAKFWITAKEKLKEIGRAAPKYGYDMSGLIEEKLPELDDMGKISSLHEIDGWDIIEKLY